MKRDEWQAAMEYEAKSVDDPRWARETRWLAQLWSPWHSARLAFWLGVVTLVAGALGTLLALWPSLAVNAAQNNGGMTALAFVWHSLIGDLPVRTSWHATQVRAVWPVLGLAALWCGWLSRRWQVSLWFGTSLIMLVLPLGAGVTAGSLLPPAELLPHGQVEWFWGLLALVGWFVADRQAARAAPEANHEA